MPCSFATPPVGNAPPAVEYEAAQPRQPGNGCHPGLGNVRQFDDQLFNLSQPLNLSE
jgi:hypothetical protein